MKTDEIKFPPQIFTRYGGEFLDTKLGKSCLVRFDVKKEDFNPLGVLLGGVYAIYFDLAMGPFSYFSTKKPYTSLDLNIDFLRPLTAKNKYVKISCEVVDKSKKFLIFSAKAVDDKGKLVATCKSRMLLLDGKS